MLGSLAPTGRGKAFQQPGFVSEEKRYSKWNRSSLKQISLLILPERLHKFKNTGHRAVAKRVNKLSHCFLLQTQFFFLETVNTVIHELR